MTGLLLRSRMEGSGKGIDEIRLSKNADTQFVESRHRWMMTLVCLRSCYDCRNDITRSDMNRSDLKIHAGIIRLRVWSKKGFLVTQGPNELPLRRGLMIRRSDSGSDLVVEPGISSILKVDTIEHFCTKMNSVVEKNKLT